MNNLQSTTWHGIPAWVLESASLRVIMVPRLGAKIVSLLDRRGDFEWLPGPMPGRPVRPVAYGAPFVEQDMAGWDEMFPTILACAYPGPGPCHGALLPDHGEAWALPWEVAGAAGGELTLTLQGRALPYRLTRSATVSQKDTLTLRYTLENLGDAPMPYMWAAHPQFLAGADCRIVLPPELTEVVNTAGPDVGWGRGKPASAGPRRRRRMGGMCVSTRSVRRRWARAESSLPGRMPGHHGPKCGGSSRATGCAWSGIRGRRPTWGCG